MKWLFFFLVCIFTTVFAFSEEESQEENFLSTPEQIAALTSEPDFLIGGLISPLSGQPVLRQVDLIVKGAQNIILSRTYIPPFMPLSFPKQKHHQEGYDKRSFCFHLKDNYKSWQFYPHLRLQLDHKEKIVRLSEPSGMTLDFHLSGPHDSVTSLASYPYAISNAAGDVPSGRYDPRSESHMKRTTSPFMPLMDLPDATIKEDGSHKQPMVISSIKRSCRMEKS